MSELEVLRVKPCKNGTEIRTVRVPAGAILMAVFPGHYRLGDPHNDVVNHTKILDATSVHWCDVDQAWIEQ